MDPDLQLLGKLISEIKTNKLFTDEDLKRCEEKIKNGKISEQDILLYLENKIIKDSIVEEKSE